MVRYKLAELLADKRFREQRRITLEEVSEATGVHRTTLSKIHNQREYNATVDILEKLCKYFEVEIGELVVFVDDPSTKKK